MTATESRLAQEIRTLAGARPGPFVEIAHELRTPLTVIAGYIELLQEGKVDPLTPAQQAMLATVDRNVTRLWRLVEDMLDSASIESHPFKSIRLPVSLTSLVARAVAAVQSQASASGVVVTARRCGRITIPGDQVQLGRLLDRLVSSAVMSASEGSRVELSADRNGTVAVLRLTTTTLDLPAADPQRACSTQPSRAVQVSLALCRAIAANHGGELESAPPSIIVRLPLTGYAPGADGNGEPLP